MNEPTFADLLAPYRSDAVAKAVGVKPDTVRLWRSRKSAPTADKIPQIAKFLRLDVSVVLNAISAQKRAVA